jgi:hypothetical protein
METVVLIFPDLYLYRTPIANHVLDADWVFAGAQPQPVSTTL